MSALETLGRVELCESLLTWIQTFAVEAPCSAVDEMTSGVAMAQVLQKIDGMYFTDAWISRIKPDVGDNWRLKISNLKKILKGILDYNHEVLGQQINDFTLPDVSLIAEHSDSAELGRMLQLILGCAVNCEQKQASGVCHGCAVCLMSKESPVSSGNDSYVDLDRQLKKTVEDLNDALATKEEIAQRCHELDMQVCAVIKSSLLAENQVLMERLNQSDSIEDLNSPAGRAQTDPRQDGPKPSSGITLLRADLRPRASESIAQSLKDEMDVLRHSSDKVSKLEAQVEVYKKKLEDLGDLRRQVKLLEEKNTSYMQNTVTLEEDLRKANAARGQLETYKRQVVELQNKLSEESKKADKMEFEYKRVKEKVDSLQKEKDRLRTERDSLKETIEELRCVKAQESQLTSGLVPLGSNEPSDLLSAEIVTPEFRERLIRLQHENKMLKLAQEGSDNEQIALLQSLLEDANSRKNELETENRLVNQRLLQGQSQVEELQKSLQEHGSKAEDVSPTVQEKLMDATNELQKKSAAIEELENKHSSNQRIEELEDALKKKDEDMKQMEERYKKYLEKAKSVIRTLDPKQNQGSAPEVQALKTQVHERERMLISLQKEYDKLSSQKDQEEKLIVSAWYNMGMALQKKAAEERLASTGSGQSFLARQRQATSSRRTYPGHVQPTAAR
uniref:Protein Hook homolog 3 n=1 Tax=Sinocyclocheilus rhinocerous TaxID=307959 RepID=A0A673I603_9TELE